MPRIYAHELKCYAVFKPVYTAGDGREYCVIDGLAVDCVVHAPSAADAINAGRSRLNVSPIVQRVDEGSVQ